MSVCPLVAISEILNRPFNLHSPEVQSILKISQPQEPELMNASPSPPVSTLMSTEENCK